MDIYDIHRSLDEDQLVPSFQPVVEFHTGRLSGFEILARWQHPQLGLVLPRNFISLAEASGLIGQVMHRILRKALLSASILPEPFLLAVNVSPTQLHDPGLPDQIRRAAEATGFPLRRLIVEITESGLVNNLELAKEISEEIKGMGCKLALDDFGTGYSSLRHLQALPFDELKIDGSFVQPMTTARESRKIVAAIIGLGHSLGLTTVAEGVETEQQANMLLWLGCKLGQGWFYGRPSTADQLPKIVAAAPRGLSGALSSHGTNWVATSLEALPMERLAQLQAIYDGAPVGLCFIDRSLRYLSLNQRLADWNGHPVAAHLGKTVREMVPELYPQFEPNLLRALRGEATPEIEVIRPGRNSLASNQQTLVSYHPAFDEAGEVIGVSVAIMDITEWRLKQDGQSSR
jgi:PAS domain S-box-containing protein